MYSLNTIRVLSAKHMYMLRSANSDLTQIALAAIN